MRLYAKISPIFYQKEAANDLSNRNILVKSAASWALVEGLGD